MSEKADHIIFILEGPRSSGKSTFARMLEDRGWSLLKFERTDDPAKHMMGVLIDLMRSKGKLVIDRFHLTEMVMRTVDGTVDLDDLTKTTSLIHLILEAVLRANTVIFMNSLDTLKERTAFRTDGKKMTHDEIQAYSIWERFAKASPPPFDEIPIARLGSIDEMTLLADALDEIAEHYLSDRSIRSDLLSALEQNDREGIVLALANLRTTGQIPQSPDAPEEEEYDPKKCADCPLEPICRSMFGNAGAIQ